MGSQLIILYAESDTGWVPNCALVFKSGNKSGKTPSFLLITII